MKDSKSVTASKVSDAGFSSRLAYIFTAVGSAVGFGNIWRFPYLVYEHGGVSFLILYILVVLCVTYPIMILEMGMGQVLRGGQAQAWSFMGKRCRPSALAAWVSFNVCTYYPLLIAWSLVFFASSFTTFGWSNPPEYSETCKTLLSSVECEAIDYCQWRETHCIADVLYKSRIFFRETVYAFSDFSGRDRDIGITGFSWRTAVALLFTWIMIILCTFAGPKFLGYSQYLTMTLPGIFLIFLVIVSATLKGAGDGVVSYIGKFDVQKFSKLTFVDVVCQSLFSASLGQGAMTSLSAHNVKTDNFVVNGLIVLVADTIFAFIAGFAVFSMIGYLAKEAELPIRQLNLAGISLAFTTYPAALTQIPGVLANLLAVVFFLTLWLLGYSTIATLVESIVLSITVSNIGRKYKLKRWQVTIALSAFFFIVPGLLLSTTMGYALLDSIDNYSAMAQGFIAGIQAFSVGWMYLAEYSIAKVGAVAYYVHALTFIGGPVLFGLFDTVQIIIALIFGIALPIIGFVAAIYLCKNSDSKYTYSLKDKIYYLTIYNVQPLRKSFNDVACQGSKFRIPAIWMYAIKYLVPYIIAYLTFTALTDSSKMYSRPEGSSYPYPWWVFLISQFSPFLFMLTVVFFFFFPDYITPFIITHEKDEEIFGEKLIHSFDRTLMKEYSGITA